MIQEIKNDISGIEALRDWLEDESPVHPIVAEFRASRCLIGNDGQPCPLNVEPNWWDQVKSRIADWIRKELELKSNMNLKVQHEEQLNMCQACGCCLRLKVWVPHAVLKKHTTKEQIAKMPDFCWIRRELKTMA